MHKTAHPMQWAIVALFGAYAAFITIRAGVGDPARSFQFREFGSLPVIEGGRIKPFDTFARGRLMMISHRQDYVDEEGNTRSATQWMLDAMVTEIFRGSKGMEHKVFRIEHEQVLALLHLEPRPGKWRYGLNEFFKHMLDLDRESKRAGKVPEKDRSVYDVKVLDLAHHLDLFIRIAKFDTPGILPTTGDWLSLREAFAEAGPNGRPDAVAVDLLRILDGYAKNDPEQFNAAVKEYHADIEKEVPGVAEAVRLEVYFNELAPFYHCAVLYGFVFLIACVSWLGWFPTLNRAAFWSMLLIAAIHTWALLIRIYIQGRPPVTNLYSSAIFIGWGCVMTCLFMEFFFRNSIALAVGAATGGLTLVIAHMLSLDSADTMEMMQAVLDTNFWLATHVTCITFGYTAMFVAGFMGITYVAAMASSAGLALLANSKEGVRRFLDSPESRQGARAFFTHFFDTDAASILGNMIYGVVCFAMFLSFTGTVLGGLWADYSWGRFWGWDPKENGALLIVIWSALILHARWGGLVKFRGIALLAVLGNIITSWSWFGTNFLGVGLHSYGFMAGAMFWLGAFDFAMLTIVGIGLLPLGYWAKLRPRPPALSAGAAADHKPEREAQRV
jgi:ABC-type transport system involved in cytochrome c biogenesis permease subunit